MWDIHEDANGQWKWFIAQSAYGAACGSEPTRAQAVVELVIAESFVMDAPLPEVARKAMRDNPEATAAEYGY